MLPVFCSRRQSWRPLTWLAAAALSSGLSGFATAQTPPANAPVQVDNAWARATVAGQQASGAFMRITAREALRLTGAETPLAGSSEIHEMKMDGEVMRMRAIEALELPAGQAVELKPGGHHVMLMQLKQSLEAGTHIPLTLIFQNAQGSESRLALQVPVRALNTGAQGQHDHGKGGGHGHKH